MHDSIFMDVLYTWKDLLHEADCLKLVDPLVFYDVVEELAALRVLHDQMDRRFCFDDLNKWQIDLIELDDVRVPENFQNADFSGYSFNIGLLHYFLLLEGLHGNLLLSEKVCPQPHFAKCPLSNIFPLVMRWLPRR